MLSNKRIIYLVLISGLLIFSSCSKEYKPPPHHLFENNNLVLKTAREVLNNKVSFTASGYFETDSVKSIVAGSEINEQDKWGIRFHLISWVDGEFVKVYSTNLLDGSFLKCTVDKLKLNKSEREFIYYNSEDYFMGTAGGEIFSYIIDFNKRQVYSAKLTVASRGRVALELSDNIEDDMIKNILIGYFKRDYPTVRVAESGI